MTIRVYDSRRREKVPFEPMTPGKVSMYVCGPTVYSNFHIGNARTFVAFDVVRRYLEYRGFDVNYVQNFTDVDDKIIARAAQEGTTSADVAKTYIEEYFKDADGLGVHRATAHPCATEHIEQILALIQTLVDNGHAYVVDGDVYFDVAEYAPYGGLSGQDLEQLEEGARVEVDQRLRNSWDFVLWKSAKPGEPKWDSPWGPGRPGWHIECSAMAEAYLGAEFDIHAGGRDLIFPHHENEIAQSGAADHPFARLWLHVGHLNIQGRKMSKSLGNYRSVRDMLADFSTEVLRFFLLSAHYRKPIDFHRTALHEAKTALGRVAILRGRMAHAMETAPPGPDGPGPLGTRAQQAIADFETAMDDDFNTPKAYAAVFDLVRDVNKMLEDGAGASVTRDGLTAVADAIATVGGVLGLFAELPEGAVADGAAGQRFDGMMGLLIELREDARREKNWAVADRIRDRLAELRVALEDGADGTHWRVID